MAQLVGLIVSEDDAFKKHFGRLLRASAIPISVIVISASRVELEMPAAAAKTTLRTRSGRRSPSGYRRLGVRPLPRRW